MFYGPYVSNETKVRTRCFCALCEVAWAGSPYCWSCDELGVVTVMWGYSDALVQDMWTRVHIPR